MATGKEMLTAVRQAIKERGTNELRLSTFDVYDLFKLTPDDLVDVGFSPEIAEITSADLLKGNLSELSRCLGVQLTKDKQQKNLIPGEGIRRTAGIWANSDGSVQSYEEMVNEIRQLRHPGAH